MLLVVFFLILNNKLLTCCFFSKLDQVFLNKLEKIEYKQVK